MRSALQRTPPSFDKFPRKLCEESVRVFVYIYIYIFQCQGIRRFTNCARLCLYKNKDYSSDPCLVEKVVRLSGKRIISSWRGFKADSNGRSIMLIKEREKVVEVDNVWVMNRGSPVRGNPTCSIIDYRVYCTISRLDGEIYTLEHTRASQVGGHATRIAELVRREFSIKFPVSRGETEIRGTLVPRLIAD